MEAVAQRRDRAAFATLFDHFGPRLNGFLLRQGCDAALAEEIVQDTLTTLWRKAELFDPAKSSLSTWLYRIARNRRIDLARRDRSDRIDPEDPILHPAPQAEPDRLMDAQQREEALRLALDQPAAGAVVAGAARLLRGAVACAGGGAHRPAARHGEVADPAGLLAA